MTQEVVTKSSVQSCIEKTQAEIADLIKAREEKALVANDNQAKIEIKQGKLNALEEVEDGIMSQQDKDEMRRSIEAEIKELTEEAQEAANAYNEKQSEIRKLAGKLELFQDLIGSE